MDVLRELTEYVRRIFKTSVAVFFEALKRSPSARGYVSGSISELLLKQHLESEYGVELERIREKWVGRKHPQHHGDFYFRLRGTERWYVLESKGLKSNSEKWHKLFNYENLEKFLIANSDQVPWINQGGNVEEQVSAWISEHLPGFRTEFMEPLYDYEEVQKYRATRDTPKARLMARLRSRSREEIEQMIRDRLSYLSTKVNVLETHFVSGTSASGERRQATPRKDEFNILAVDICLRYPEHKFLFVNPQNLESSGGDPNHLQQNYVIGFVFKGSHGQPELSVAEDWSDNFTEVMNTLDPRDCVSPTDMQADTRYLIGDEVEEAPRDE